MSEDDPLAAYGARLYQGIGDGAGSPAELAARALALTSPEEREPLRLHLRHALANLNASELKGKLKRANENYWFTSKGAHTFLQATLDQLEAGA